MWEKMKGVCSNGAEGRIISMADAALKYPGFKFPPSDAGLISYYLTKKLEGLDKSVERLIPEVDISAHEPWDLPGWSFPPCICVLIRYSCPLCVFCSSCLGEKSLECMRFVFLADGHGSVFGKSCIQCKPCPMCKLLEKRVLPTEPRIRWAEDAVCVLYLGNMTGSCVER